MKDKSKHLSIIDKGLKVKGAVHAEGRLIISGEMEGTLAGETVVTTPGSCVRADADVSEITIAGEFTGTITARERIIILSTGDLRGNVAYKNLTLEAGGLLNGRVRFIASHNQPASQSSAT